MLKALPILVILALAIYSFFDVLKTPDLLIKRGPKAMWVILALVPVFGAALWFLLGRPGADSSSHQPPRGVTLRRGTAQVAPDDDASFLRRLDDEAWVRKRDEARSKDKAAGAARDSSAEATGGSADTPDVVPETDVAKPASDETSAHSSEGTTERKPQAEEQPPGEQDL
jgi:hypothetical protein